MTVHANGIEILLGMNILKLIRIVKHYIIIKGRKYENIGRENCRLYV